MNITETQWPPKELAKVFADMERFQAWTGGNPDEIQQRLAQSQLRSAAIYSTGITGQVARLFWKRPNPQQTQRLHVPAPRDVARASSNLLFAQPPKFIYPEDDDPRGKVERERAQRRLDTVLNNSRVFTTLSEAGELASVHGGVYLRLWWDADAGKHVMLDKVPALRAVPKWRYDQLTEVTFVHVVDSGQEGGKIIRHLEHHQPGSISHALFAGDSSSLGKQISLSDHDSTAWLENTGDGTGVVNTGTDELTAAYVRNPGESWEWASETAAANFGRSDFEALEPLFDALDEVYTSWMRDVRTGKSRIFVGEDMLQDLGPGQGGAWDHDQEVFTPLKTGLGSALDGDTQITQSQFPIRWQEHSQTAAEILNTILRDAGLSAAHFSDSMLTIGVQTATEVKSRDSIVENTRKKKLAYFSAAMTSLANTAMLIDADVFRSGVKYWQPLSIEFPERSSETPAEKTQYLSQQRSNNMVSMETSVRELRPQWTNAEVEAEIQRIRQDMLDAMNLSYGKGFNPPPEGEAVPEGMDTPDGEGMTELSDLDALANELAGGVNVEEEA